MPDISKCNGNGCPQANECYRFRAIPSEYRQAYFSTPPLNDEGKCSYFWPIINYAPSSLQPVKEPK